MTHKIIRGYLPVTIGIIRSGFVAGQTAGMAKMLALRALQFCVWAVFNRDFKER